MSGDSGCCPLLSVIVCTHGCAEQLRGTLLSLSRQSVASHRYEILVVDNNSSPSNTVQSIVKDMASAASSPRALNIRYVHCPTAGISPARNAGMAEARGGILSFIDDDAVACPNWLEQIGAAFEAHPDTGVIGGHILLQVPAPRPPVLRPGLERYWSQFVTPYAGYTEVSEWARFPWGANWSARKDALLRVGGFRKDYGRRDANYWGGEELVAAAQIRSLGYKIAVLPQAQVMHVVDPSRFTRMHLWRTVLASALVSYRAQRDLHLQEQAESGKLRNPLRRLDGLAGSYADVTIMRLAAQLILALIRLRDFFSGSAQSVTEQ